MDSGFFRLWTSRFIRSRANWCPLFSGIPRLLVSVRNAEEALSAIRGGADVVDVKEPAHGSLGRASLENLTAVAKYIRERKADADRPGAESVPLSIALGEVEEWNSSSTCFAQGSTHHSMATEQGTSDLLCESISQLHPRYLKLGLSNASGPRSSASSWRNGWIDVRCRFEGDHEWVAVAYADHDRANAPAPDEVLDAALETNCSVLLIDTFVKDGTSLLDWLRVEQLAGLRKKTSAHGLQLALAGKVTLSELPLLLPLQPDIIAVRGAVCQAGVRTATVSETLVAEFVARLQHC
jgi:uncharacterized protein (UPF0264 family)